MVLDVVGAGIRNTRARAPSRTAVVGRPKWWLAALLIAISLAGCGDADGGQPTAAAAAQLINQAGGELVGCSFVIELAALAGRQKLPQSTPVESLVIYS